jgi:hypothetical protein
MANAQVFEAGWEEGQAAAQQRRARKQALSDEEFKLHLDEAQQNIGNLQQKLANFTPGTTDYLQTKQDLDYAIQSRNDLFHPAKNPGALQKFGHLLRLTKAPQPQSMTMQPAGIQQPAYITEPVEIGAQPGYGATTAAAPPKAGAAPQEAAPINPYETMVIPNPKGLIEAGNLPIWNRPTVQNADGSHSSELSISIGDDQGREVLVPTVVNGKFLTPDGKMPPLVNGKIPPAEDWDKYPQWKALKKAAWNHFQKTGENLGKFDNPDNANAYAQTLHSRGKERTPQQVKEWALYQMVAAPSQPVARIGLTAQPGLEAMTIPGMEVPAGPALPAGPAVKVQGPAQTPGQLRARALANQKAQQEANMLAAGAPLSLEQQAVQQAQAASAGELATIQGKMRNYDILYPDATQEQRQARLDELMQTTQTGNFKTQNLILADGSEITAQQDAKTGKWYDMNNKPIPPELLKTAKVAPKPTANKGLKFDTATGQVIDQQTGTRYNEGDPKNPATVQAMFASMNKMTAKKQAFMEKLALIRGASYGQARQMAPLSVLDTWKGNAPDYVPYTEMRKYPGRYLPAGEADKALARENLMQDIMGTSKLTRDAINNLQQDFPEEMKVKIALAMRADDPHLALDQLIASGALGSLSDDQQDFLIATRQLAENAMAMRTILGAGQGSEDMRNAIRQTLPGLLTPDRSMALRQLDAFDKTIARLHRGVPKVPLRTDIDTGGGAASGATLSRGRVSLKAAMALPQNKGKSEEWVENDLKAHNWTVTRP